MISYPTLLATLCYSCMRPTQFCVCESFHAPEPVGATRTAVLLPRTWPGVTPVR